MTKKTAVIQRCAWAGNDPLMSKYHDEEWGVPERDSRALWEALMLDGFQAGLSWLTILRKRDAFRKAFRNFDPKKVARMGEADIARLLQNEGIIRSRAKIEATVHNARLLTSMSLNDIAWQYRPRHRHPLRQWSDGRSDSPESHRLATTLRQHGVRFVGPVVAHSFMQTVGIENGHFDGCFRAPAPG